jgi:PAS domain S-box-containing protein
VELDTVLINWKGKPATLNFLIDITERKRVENILEESERELKALFKSMLNAFVLFESVFDQNGNFVSYRFVYINDAYERITGVKNDEVKGKTVHDVWPKTEASWVKAYGDVATTGVPSSFDMYHEPTGKLYHCNVYRPWDTKDRFCVVFEDITDRKRAEEEIQRTNTLLNSIVENIPNMIFLKDARELRFTRFNRAGEELLGHSRGDLLGKNDYDFFPKEQADFFVQKDREVLRGKEIVDIDEEPIQTRDKGERILHTKKVPILNAEGEPEYLMGISEDITDRKQAEEELQNAYKRLNEIIDFLPDATLVIDLGGKVIAWNRAMEQMSTVPKAEMIGKGNYEYALPFYSQRRPLLVDLAFLPDDVFEKAHYANIFRQSDNLHAETHVPGIYGGKGAFLWGTASRLRDASGNIIGAIESIRDITDRKNSMDQLRKALGGTVQAIALVVESKDPYTAGHQRRVADISRAIATEMGLTPDRIEGIRMAGIIHDIGKVSVPAEILSSPRKLTNLEFSLIQTHAQSGYDILKDIEFPWPIARMVLEHHERMNGSGYPNGLTGDQILPESRILAVADVVEAMATHRPYRPALGLDKALEEITLNRGLLYDPEVVDACLRLFREKGYEIKE